MKTFKRVLSSFLALLMIFSSVSVLSVSAAGDGSKNATFYTKFFAQNAEGEWEEVTQVKAGTTVKARTYIESDYMVGTSNIFWVYSKNFMELDLTGWSQTGVRYEFPNEKNPVINPSATSFPTANGWKGSFTTATEPAGVSEGDASYNLIYDEYLTEEFFNDKGWIALRLENGKPKVLNADEFLFEFTFNVKSNPEGEGFLYVEEEAVQDTDWYSYAYTFIGEARTSSSFSSIEGWEYDYTYSFKDKNTISLFTETSTTYTQNVYTMDTEGNYGVAATTTPTVEIGATIKASDYAAPAGFTVDTAKSSADVTAADDGSSVMNVYLKREKYTVSFDGVPTEQFYDAVIQPAKAEEKEGYTFDGWYSGANKLTETTKVPVDGAAYVAKYTAIDVGYTVNKYFMNTDGTTYAEPVPQKFPGKTDDVVSYADENIEGFKLDTTLGNLSGTVTGDGKLVLNAYYTRSKVNVTIDGEKSEAYYGTTIEKPETPPAEAGYEFDKWVDGAGNEIGSWPITVGTTDIVINSVFEKLPRTVTYKYVGAPSDYEVPDAKIAYIGDVIELPDLPEDEAYIISDWVITDAEGNTITDGKVGTSNVTVTATWTKKTYTVQFYADEEGTVPFGDAVTYEHGQLLAYPEKTPEILGKTFDTWSEAKDTPVKSNLNIVPVFTTDEYTVTVLGFDDIEFAETKGWKATYGEEITLADLAALNTDVENYVFEGWYYNGEKMDADTVITVTDDITITANYVGAEAKLVFKADGALFDNGSDTYEVALKIDDEITEDMYPTVPEYEGHTFNRWSEDLVGQTMTETEVVITIKWDVNSYSIKFVNGLTGDEETVSGLYGDPVEMPELPTATGYTFAWNATVTSIPARNENGELMANGGTMTITAVPTANVHTVTYMNGDAVVTTKDVAFGTAIDSTVALETVPAGFNFLGWSLEKNATAAGDLGTMPDGDVTVYAVLQEKGDTVYTVEIYKENLEGGYDLVSSDEYNNGTVGQPAPYVIDKNVEGFVYNEADSLIPDAIEGDGTSVLEIYYDRKVINVQIGDDEPIEVPYGKEIDLPDDPDDNDPGTEFDKWVDEDGNEVSDPFIVPDSEDDIPVVITPVYKNLFFDVIFIDELNGTTKTSNLEYSTVIPNPGTPSAVGFEFDGWYTKDAEGNYVDKYVSGTTTVPSAGVTYYAKYTGLEVTYTVNVYFEELDGTWGDAQTESVPGIAGEKAEYTKTFEGFTLDTKNSVTEAIIKGDNTTVLVIYFTRNDVKITVDGEEKDVPYGTVVTEEELEKDVTVDPGYKIDKWTDADGNEITFPVEIKGGEEFNPEIVKDTFTVKFQLEDGTPVGETTAEFDSEYAAPQAPEAPEGFTFAGWLDKATNTYYDGKIPAKDAVYVAHYTNNDEAEYTVNIYIMNTSGVEELSGSYKATAAIGTTQSVVPGTVAFCTLDTVKSNTSCVVLADNTASINLYFVRGLYTVSFDGEETQVYAGAAIPVPADPAQDGKKFTGWTPEIPDVMPEENLEFASTWEDVKYTITYIVNDTKVVHEYLFGEKVTAYEVTEAPAGLVFDSWLGTIPETMPAENIVVSAIFKAAAYTVTYLNADGNVFESYSVAYGAEIPVPATNPEKKFHKFVKWDNILETMPNYNVTIKPVFEPDDVRLIPVDGSSTVIDRERMIIYGLEENLTAKILDDLFLDYEGDGTLVIKPVTEGTSRYGTGAVVELYDNADGSLVETFHIVVFGDLNGDSFVNGIDVSIASDEAFWISDWSIEGSAEYDEYRTIAANLDSKNSVIDSTDVSNIKNYVLSLVDIDQTTGKIVRS